MNETSHEILWKRNSLLRETDGMVPFQSYLYHFAQSETVDFDPSPALRNPKGSQQYQKFKSFGDELKNGYSKSVSNLGGIEDKYKLYTYIPEGYFLLALSLVIRNCYRHPSIFWIVVFVVLDILFVFFYNIRSKSANFPYSLQISLACMEAWLFLIVLGLKTTSCSCDSKLHKK